MIACDPYTQQTSALVYPRVTSWVHANAAESVQRGEGSTFLRNVSTHPPDYNREYCMLAQTVMLLTCIWEVCMSIWSHRQTTYCIEVSSAPPGK
jgi:hypothetical protein